MPRASLPTPAVAEPERLLTAGTRPGLGRMAGTLAALTSTGQAG